MRWEDKLLGRRNYTGTTEELQFGTETQSAGPALAPKGGALPSGPREP